MYFGEDVLFLKSIEEKFIFSAIGLTLSEQNPSFSYYCRETF
jgi:hypothetical protein